MRVGEGVTAVAPHTSGFGEWPASLTDTTHSVALTARKAALCGEIEADTARGLFTTFAEKQDLMAPKTSAAIVTRYRNGDPHAR